MSTTLMIKSQTQIAPFRDADETNSVWIDCVFDDDDQTELKLVDVLAAYKDGYFVKSKSEARRKIKEGAVYVGKVVRVETYLEKVTDINYMLSSGIYVIKLGYKMETVFIYDIPALLDI